MELLILFFWFIGWGISVGVYWARRQQDQANTEAKIILAAIILWPFIIGYIIGDISNEL